MRGGDQDTEEYRAAVMNILSIMAGLLLTIDRKVAGAPMRETDESGKWERGLKLLQLTVETATKVWGPLLLLAAACWKIGKEAWRWLAG